MYALPVYSLVVICFSDALGKWVLLNSETDGLTQCTWKDASPTPPAPKKRAAVSYGDRTPRKEGFNKESTLGRFLT